MENLLATALFFGLCMALMSAGILLSGRQLRGSCGGAAQNQSGNLDTTEGCGFCVKKENDVCASSDENGVLIKLATLGNPQSSLH